MTTEFLRDLSNILLWVGLLLAACGTAGVNYFRGRLEREREATASANDKQAQDRASALQTRVDDLLSRNEAVASQNQKLLGDIQQSQQQLRDREERIHQLEETAKAAKRGVFERYDFNGAKRSQSGGSMSVSAGAEFEVFGELVRLEKSREWSQIVRLAEKQIKLTPDWLTPYLFLGGAYVNLDNRDKAITYLQYVVDHSGGDPEYKQAVEMLNRIRSGHEGRLPCGPDRKAIGVIDWS